MNKLLIVSMLLLSESAMAGKLNLHEHPIAAIHEVIHPINEQKIDHVSGHKDGDHEHHHRNHIHPLCSCIGNIHIPFDRIKEYQPY